MISRAFLTSASASGSTSKFFRLRRKNQRFLSEFCKIWCDFNVFVSAYAEPHPESPSVEYDLELLKEKVDAGATSAITQFCFDLHKLADLKNALVRDNIAIELIPGVMPVRNIDNLKRMADRCGINIPKDVATRFDVPEDEQRKAALDLAVQQVATLKQIDFDSFHFYTLNQSNLIEDLLAAI